MTDERGAVVRPWVVERVWAVGQAGNTVRVEHAAHDNGGSERIHYTSLRERTPGYDEFQHVKDSAVGHGYGPSGRRAAEDRVRDLLNGGWRALVKHNKAAKVDMRRPLEREETRAIVAEQFRSLKGPAETFCGGSCEDRRVPVRFMYRCFDCGVWFCERCMAEHMGRARVQHPDSPTARAPQAAEPLTEGERGAVLVDFCATYGPGFKLEPPAEHHRPLGDLTASPHAQLCEDNIIAAHPTADALNSIAHEIGHGMVLDEKGLSIAFSDEARVREEQIRFLSALAGSLFLQAPQAAEGEVSDEERLAVVGETLPDWRDTDTVDDLETLGGDDAKLLVDALVLERRKR